MRNSTAIKAGRASLGLVAVGLAVCSLLLALDYFGDPTPAPATSGQPGAPTFTRPTDSPTIEPSAVPTTPDAEPPPTRDPNAGVPVGVQIEALGIDVPVVPIQLEVSTLVPPSDPQTLGWWSGGAVAGAERGGAIITGHTVHTGGGALDNLETLRPGDVFRVRTDAGSIRYAVSKVEVFDKSRISRAAERIFSRDVRGRLLLITCEDWDGTGYNSNVVVYSHAL